MQKVFQSKKYRLFVAQLGEKGHGVFLGTIFLMLYNTIIFFVVSGCFNLISCITGFDQQDIGG